MKRCAFCHKRKRLPGVIACQRCVDFRETYVLTGMIPRTAEASNEDVELVSRELGVNLDLARLLITDHSAAAPMETYLCVDCASSVTVPRESFEYLAQRCQECADDLPIQFAPNGQHFELGALILDAALLRATTS